MSNLKQIGTAVLMYLQDSDETYPMTMETVSSGAPTTVSYWAIQGYHGALDPYIKMGRGQESKANVWWDPSDPDRDELAMWGSFTDNGLLTGTSRTLADIAAPAGTVYAILRADKWGEVVGVTPPNPLPARTDPFWQSEYFDMCLDPWDVNAAPGSFYHWSRGNIIAPCSLYPSAPAGCGNWDKQINQTRYNNKTLMLYADAHVKSTSFDRTFRSATDSDWDLK